MKKILIIVLILIVVGGVNWFITKDNKSEEQNPPVEEKMEVQTDAEGNSYEIIGISVDGREIQSYRFGNGETTLVYVGGIHGGYEWNSALLSYELVDYFTANPLSVPEDINVVVIPVANPDGLASILGSSGTFEANEAPQFNFTDGISIDDPVAIARFNANGVDLNRNFDCKWQTDATWRTYSIDAGTEVFSEPEAVVLRDFLLDEQPEAVVFFHSASDGVYTSFCEGDELPGTVELLTAYSVGSGYTLYDDYPYYEVTGDAADWLSTQGISAITVELSTHDVIEFEKNLAGIEAMFTLYSELD